MAKKFLQKALIRAYDQVMKMIVLPLMQWASESDDDAYFFIVVGNKYINDVAWFNSENLSCEGAFSIAQDPDAAAVFQFITTGVDFFIEDNVKDKDFNDAYQAHVDTSKVDNGWASIDVLPNASNVRSENDTVTRLSRD